jgi:hypothetical protein
MSESVTPKCGLPGEQTRSSTEKSWVDVVLWHCIDQWLYLKKNPAIVDLSNLIVLEKSTLQYQVHDVQIRVPLGRDNELLVHDLACCSSRLSDLWQDFVSSLGFCDRLSHRSQWCHYQHLSAMCTLCIGSNSAFDVYWVRYDGSMLVSHLRRGSVRVYRYYAVIVIEFLNCE